MERYDQCDDTCTTDCGHCKGAGRPLRMIRALTVRQPWAWAIVHGGKDVENRTRNIAGSYRGPVAIHSGLADALLSSDELDRFWLHADGWPYAIDRQYGVVIGVVDLVDVHTHPYADHAEAVCWPWGMAGHRHLVFENPRALAKPIPAKGRLGLWIPDGALQDAIWEQVDA